MSANIKNATTGEPITLSIEGMDQVMQDLADLSDDLRTRVSVDMLTDVGNQAVDWIKENIRSTFKNRTGNLENSIFAAVLTNENGTDVYVGPNLQTAPYGRIHEYGGDIYPKTKKFLHFWVDGNEVFTKHVYIPARPYIQPAFDDHSQEIMDTFENYIFDAIAEGCADL